MVPVAGFDAEDAGVASRAVEVALAEGGEEGGEVFEGFLDEVFFPLSVLFFFLDLFDFLGGEADVQVCDGICLTYI